LRDYKIKNGCALRPAVRDFSIGTGLTCPNCADGDRRHNPINTGYPLYSLLTARDGEPQDGVLIRPRVLNSGFGSRGSRRHLSNGKRRGRAVFSRFSFRADERPVFQLLLQGFTVREQYVLGHQLREIGHGHPRRREYGLMDSHGLLDQFPRIEQHLHIDGVFALPCGKQTVELENSGDAFRSERLLSDEQINRAFVPQRGTEDPLALLIPRQARSGIQEPLPQFAEQARADALDDFIVTRCDAARQVAVFELQVPSHPFAPVYSNIREKIGTRSP